MSRHRYRSLAIIASAVVFYIPATAATAAPQLQSYCRDYRRDPLVLQLHRDYRLRPFGSIVFHYRYILPRCLAVDQGQASNSAVHYRQKLTVYGGGA